MSTTARKARKRAHFAALGVPDTFPELVSATEFIHPVKTGTPVPLRAENQPYPHIDGGTRKPVNAVSAKGKRRLAEYEARTAAAGNGTPWPDHRRASRAA